MTAEGREGLLARPGGTRPGVLPTVGGESGSLAGDECQTSAVTDRRYRTGVRHPGTGGLLSWSIRR